MPVILHAVGARPNLVKMAPVVDALRPHANIEQRLVHTGQHYDAMMSDELFVDLELPEPDISLGVGSGTHGEQTGRVLIATHPPRRPARPGRRGGRCQLDGRLRAGGRQAGHLDRPRGSGPAVARLVHAGGDHRVLTDRLSDLLFTHSPEAPRNLAAECISAIRVHAVGNTMGDS
jgi:UDP-N-acetylglucosamine 2-epimerase (non-hydrolysing)